MDPILDHNKEKPGRRGGKPHSPFLRWVKLNLYYLYWMLFPQDRRIVTLRYMLTPVAVMLALVILFMLIDWMVG